MTKNGKLTIPKLKNRLRKLIRYSEKYSKNKLSRSEEIQSKLGQQEYKIAVVANMSAGKSTFINALFGTEILPAYNHATTDCATYIYSEPGNDKKAVVYFNDGKDSIELGESMLSEINQYAQKDEECEDDKYKNVERIDLYYPFKYIQTSSNEDFKILFVDTPGPNSTGNGYKAKHKDQTRSVLNKVDLALFLFDYEQLDANLSSDEQGLWQTIKTRSESDEDFDIYFLLNKIDAAFDDYFKDIDNDDTFADEMQKQWFTYEQTAINKLRDAAIEHGIKDPKIYPISSQYALYTRDKKINRPERKKRDDFAENFKEIFKNSWEEKLIEYLGISKLEEDINSHINNVVKEKILHKLDQTINKIVEEENSELVRREITLKKPKEEAEENLKKANEFLYNKSKSLQDEMKSASSEIQDKYNKQIEELIDSAIQKELEDKVAELATRTIYFAKQYAMNPKSVSDATKDANKIPLDNMAIKLQAEKVEIKLNDSIEIQQVMQVMQNYMLTLLQSYKNNYLDIRTNIKESYHDFDVESSELLQNYKGELEKNLNKVLDVKFEEIQTDKLELSTLPNIDIEVPNSVLDYKHENAQYKDASIWWKPWTWGDTEKVKVEDEKHIFIIKPKELLQSIEKSVYSGIDGFYFKEIVIHKDTIKNHLDNFLDIFQDFRHEKEKEIKRLETEIKNNEASLKNLEKQKKEFQQSQIED